MDKLLTLPSGTPQKMDTRLKTETYKWTFCPYHSKLQSLFLTLYRADTTLRIRRTFILITLYKATVVCALWLAAEPARFSCNEQALWIFFKVVKFGLDLDVIKTKIVPLSKKLCLVVSIASTGLFQFTEHDLEWPSKLATGCWKLLPKFLHIRDNLLTSSTQSLREKLRLHLDVMTSVWDFPVMTSLLADKWYLMPVLMMYILESTV